MATLERAMKKLLWLLLLAPSFALAQQHPIHCPRGSTTSCTTSAPADPTAMDPPWLIGGNVNTDFSQWFTLSGIAVGTNGGAPRIATSSDIISLWTGCSGTQYLGADGACHTGGGGGGVTLQTNSTNNSSQTTLNLQSGNGIAVTNPSAGNVSFAVTQPFRTVSGTTDTVNCTTDLGGVIEYQSASATAVTLPVCAANFAFTMQTAGAGTVTITPSSGTINGASSLAVAQNQGCSVWSDGTNAHVASCTALSGGGSSVNVQTFTTSGTWTKPGSTSRTAPLGG